LDDLRLFSGEEVLDTMARFRTELRKKAGSRDSISGIRFLGGAIISASSNTDYLPSYSLGFWSLENKILGAGGYRDAGDTYVFVEPKNKTNMTSLSVGAQF